MHKIYVVKFVSFVTYMPNFFMFVLIQANVNVLLFIYIFAVVYKGKILLHCLQIRLYNAC